MSDTRKMGLGEGIRTGIGILTAVKDTIVETVQEAVDRGDLAPDRATALVKDAAHRLQLTLDEARERLDLVPRKEFDALQAELAALRARVEKLEGASAPRLTDGETGGSFVID